MRRRAGILILMVAFFAGNAYGATILETAPSPATNGGTSILTTQFLGARFYLDTDYEITSIGGNVKGHEGADRLLFAAIIPLYGSPRLPKDFELSDAIFATTFTAPFNNTGTYPFPVPDTLIQTDLILHQGWYGLVFGSGLFGATGEGHMPIAPYNYKGASYFYRNTFINNDWRNFVDEPIRFLVNGEEPGKAVVPIPPTVLLLATGLLVLIGIGKSKG